MDRYSWLSLVAVLFLAAVHLFAGKLRFTRSIPRSRWLSFGGGVSVGYVCLHLLPELHEAQSHIEEARPFFGVLKHHVFVSTLTGLLLFYALERYVQCRRGEGPKGEADQSPERDGAFWLHVASFGIYNALIGFLIGRSGRRDLAELALFTIALALHFVVNDFGLREHHKRLYDRQGRWILAATIPAGWGVALHYRFSEAVIGLVVGFLAGAIILNVFKEELPEERESKLIPFIGGAAGYAALLLLI